MNCTPHWVSFSRMVNSPASHCHTSHRGDGGRRSERVQPPEHLPCGIGAVGVDGDGADERPERAADDGRRGRAGPAGDAHDVLDPQVRSGPGARGAGRGLAGGARHGGGRGVEVGGQGAERRGGLRGGQA